MKKLTCFFLLSPLINCFSQTTHSVTVVVNQPPVCTVVSLEKNADNELQVYPNPATEIVYIKNISDETKFEVHDAIGRIVLLQSFSTTQRATVDVTFLPRGIYYIRVRSGRKIFQSKLVLE